MAKPDDLNPSKNDSWQDNQALEERQMAEKYLAKSGGSSLQDLAEQVSRDISPIMKAILDQNGLADDGTPLAEILTNDPKAMKSFEKMMKGKSVESLMKTHIDSLTDMVTTMQIDPDITRDSIDNYDFIHERVKPVVLRRAGNSIPARMIKQYRFHQLTEFAKNSDGKRPGFKLVFSDSDYKPTKAEQKTLRKFEEVFANKFFFVPNENKPNLGKWLSYAFSDFFDMDKIAIEVVRTTASTNKKANYKGEPLGLMLVDAGSIMHVVPKQKGAQLDQWRWDRHDFEGKLEEAGIEFEYVDDYRYLQVDRNGVRQMAYTEANMILSHAFGSSDMNEQFQGFSIIEQSLQIIRYIIDSIIYNYTRRSSGTMPKGMINVVGATEDGFSRQEMETFRKIIWGIASGRKDKWKYPVLGTPKGVKTEFIKFHESSREMEDFTWLSTLFSVMCSLAGMDPENIAMASQKNVIGKSSMFGRSEEEGANYRSQDEGLRFYLTYTAGIINGSGIIEQLTGLEGVVWEFVGLDVEDETKKRALEKSALETSASINDLLTAQDKETKELIFGGENIFDIPGIGNTTVIQLILQALQAKAQEEMGDQFGFFGGEDGGAEPPPFEPQMPNAAEPDEAGKPEIPGAPKPAAKPKKEVEAPDRSKASDAAPIKKSIPHVMIRVVHD